MPRFINDSLFRPESFLAGVPLWNWQVNGYEVTMIIWNIFLGILAIIITYYLVTVLRRKNKKGYVVGLLSLAWLLMMPNTAYLLTDARHIIGYCPSGEYGNVCVENAWMTFFFFIFAATGWLSFIWALRPVRSFLTKKYGQKWGRVFITIMIPLTALAVLLGLLNRWNSWEVFSRPDLIVSTSFHYLTNLTYFKNWLIMSFLLALLYFSGEKLFYRFKWEK